MVLALTKSSSPSRTVFVNVVDEVLGIEDVRLGANLDDDSLAFFLIDFGDEETDFFSENEALLPLSGGPTGSA